MGLNLSRGKPTKYYSSNRIASLIGNGLLTFIDKKTQLNDFFNKNEIEAQSIAFEIYKLGHALAGIYDFQIAEQKI